MWLDGSFDRIFNSDSWDLDSCGGCSGRSLKILLRGNYYCNRRRTVLIRGLVTCGEYGGRAAQKLVDSFFWQRAALKSLKCGGKPAPHWICGDHFPCNMVVVLKEKISD